MNATIQILTSPRHIVRVMKALYPPPPLIVPMRSVLQQAVVCVRAGMGLGLAVALGVSNTLETLTVNQYFYMLFRVALHLKVRPTTYCSPLNFVADRLYWLDTHLDDRSGVGSMPELDVAGSFRSNMP